MPSSKGEAVGLGEEADRAQRAPTARRAAQVHLRKEKLADGSALAVQGTKSAAEERSAKLLRWMLWGFVLFFLSIGLFVAILICRANVSEYWAATPTTATVDNCKDGGDDYPCTGTWSLGGQSYHGEIEEVESPLPPGTTVDVRANVLRAYVMTYAPSLWDWTPAFFAGALLAIAGVVIVMSERWIRRKGR